MAVTVGIVRRTVIPLNLSSLLIRETNNPWACIDPFTSSFFKNLQRCPISCLLKSAHSRHFRDCPGIARPNWPDAQLLETAPCCLLFRLEEPTLPLDRSP